MKLTSPEEWVLKLVSRPGDPQLAYEAVVQAIQSEAIAHERERAAKDTDDFADHWQGMQDIADERNEATSITYGMMAHYLRMQATAIRKGASDD